MASLCSVLITGAARSTNALVQENAWTVGWGGVGYDGGVVTQPLDDGSIITVSNVGTDTLMKKFDSNGSLQWSHPFENISPAGIFTAWSSTLLPDGRALFFGDVEQDPIAQPYKFDAALIAISSDGVATVVSQFGGPGQEFVKSVGICSDGSFFVGGSVWSGSVDPGNSVSIGMVDLFVARFDSSFHRLWIKQFGSTNNDALFSVSCESNNSAVVSAWGAASINGQGSDRYYNFYVIKYGASGNLISTINSEQDIGYWSPQSGVAAPDGSLYVVGEHNGRNLGSLPCTQQALGGSFISKYSSSGTLLWRQIIDCGNLNRQVAVDAWGNPYVLGGAGNIRVAGQQKYGGDDILLHKYNSDGDRLWTRQFGSSDDEYGNSIAIDREGNVFIGVTGKGLFDGYQPSNEWDAFLIKNRVGETGVKADPAKNLFPIIDDAIVTSTSTSTSTTSTIASSASTSTSTIASSASTSTSTIASSTSTSTSTTSTIASLSLEFPLIAAPKSALATIEPLVPESKSTSARSIAAYAKIEVISTSKVSIKVVPAYAKNCKVSGSALKRLRIGPCKVTVTVKPKNGRAISKIVSVFIAL